MLTRSARPAGSTSRSGRRNQPVRYNPPRRRSGPSGMRQIGAHPREAMETLLVVDALQPPHAHLRSDGSLPDAAAFCWILLVVAKALANNRGGAGNPACLSFPRLPEGRSHTAVAECSDWSPFSCID